LAEGRKTYGRAIRADFAANGFDDIPKLGPRLLGGMQRFGAAPPDIARDFGISKQAARQAGRHPVVRGYLERAVGAEAVVQMRPTLGALVALDD
jgi:hypothetical protein